jgi:hypothetical protein
MIRRRQVGWVIAAALAGLGVYFLIDSLHMTTPRPFAVADLEAGTAPPGRWLELTGRLQADERIIWDGPNGRETYVPLVSDRWQPGRPVAVFVRAYEAHWGEPGRLLHHEGATVAGLAARHGLPEEVRALFVRNDWRPAVNALVLDYDGSPGDELLLGLVAVAAGLLILFAVEFLWLRRQSDGKDASP